MQSKTQGGNRLNAETLEQHKEAIRGIVAQAVVRSKVERLHYDGTADSTEFTKVLNSVLADIGIKLSEEETPQLPEDIKNYLGIDPEEFEDLPSTNKNLSLESFLVFKEWIAEESGPLVVKHDDSYRPNGVIGPKNFSLFDDVQIPPYWGYLCIYQGMPCYVYFQRQSEFFVVTVTGEEGDKLLTDLIARLNACFAKKYKGKMIDQKLRLITVKEYRRDELVYPKALGKKVDDMLVCLKKWFSSPRVIRWGYTLIGGPGKGKTSVGGLVAHERPEGCTFLYCPAGELKSERDINYLFEIAELLAPTILQIDDFDLISKKRRIGNVSLTSALMENLDGLKEGNKIFVILTSNDTSNIEKAIIDRAGRICSKIVFEGYAECMPELIGLGRREYSLNISDEAINSAIETINKEKIDLSPDEAMNVCKRLHLLYDTEEISSTQLKDTIEEVYDAFHNAEYDKSYLEDDSEDMSNGVLSLLGSFHDNGD